ncbi:HAD family hydrolase [Olivibacter sitiensis]|uniref:HAD family hydrolase n=1 Tax=Olivibacter sitiensis TaxID=376470 RepID=UPI0004275349|nr:HAD family phosphatase [Olivibacter sitiensis]
MQKYKAVLFDLNGTMVDDMQYHIQGWKEALHKCLGVDVGVERLNREMYGKNVEVLKRLLPDRGFSPSEIRALEKEKEERYRKNFEPHLKLLDGLYNFLFFLQDHRIKIAIGSAAIQENIDFVLDGLHIRSMIDAVVSADEVKESKPSPETYLQCASKLQLPPAECLVFEDNPNGVLSAQRAGMDAVVVMTMHGPDDFVGLDNVKAFVADFTDPILREIMEGNFDETINKGSL